VLQSLLFEVSPLDPRALAGATGVILVMSLAAAYVPARRAASTEPATVLRTI
jgi:ABC-type lipoprotein release transport system permease subunit